MKLHHQKYLPMISALVDEDLNQEQRDRVEKHIHLCDECKQIFEDFRRLKTMASGAKPFFINSHYLTRIRVALRRRPKEMADVVTIEARLLVPLLTVLVLGMLILFSVAERERAILPEDYLYFGGRKTAVEQQILSRLDPLTKDEVLLLTVSTPAGEEGNGQ